MRSPIGRRDWVLPEEDAAAITGEVAAVARRLGYVGPTEALLVKDRIAPPPPGSDRPVPQADLPLLHRLSAAGSAGWRDAGGGRSGSPWAWRTKPRWCLRDRVGSAREDRDTVRAQLRELRHELRQDEAFPGHGEGPWRRHRGLLVGAAACPERREDRPSRSGVLPGRCPEPVSTSPVFGLRRAGIHPRLTRCRTSCWRGRPGSSVFHLHWTRIFQAGAETEEAAAGADRAGPRPDRGFLGAGWAVVVECA